MCIILYKPEGAYLPSHEVLRNCFSANPDGAGLMYPAGNKIQIRKGLMDVQTLIKTAYRVSRNNELIIHFRYATHGDKSPGQTHPFPVSMKISDLTALSIKCDVGITHNGVISEYSTMSKETGLSDTMLFTKRLSALDNPVSKEGKTLMQKSYSKFAVMTTKDTLLVGNFIKDSGCYYSNATYRAIEEIPEVIPLKAYRTKYPSPYEYL
jgi:predicted glutamine amidotransferase